MKRLIRNGLTIPWTPFYRRYPYHHGVSIASADDRGFVDFDLGVFCNRIPKAANSSVIVNLAYRRFGREIPSKEAKRLFRTPSQLKASELDELASLYKFAFVRNPYTRVLSAFLDKVDRRTQRKGQEASFHEFLDRLENGELYSNAHWAPQVSLLLLPFEQFDFFGKTEHLDRDLGEVLKHLHTDIDDPRILSALGNATGASGKLTTYFDDETKARVDTLYRADFEAFGYPMELPLKNSGNPTGTVTTSAQGEAGP